MAYELRRLLADGIDSVDKTKILATERELWKDARSLSFLIRTLSNLDAHHILFFLGFSFFFFTREKVEQLCCCRKEKVTETENVRSVIWSSSQILTIQ